MIWNSLRDAWLTGISIVAVAVPKKLLFPGAPASPRENFCVEHAHCRQMIRFEGVTESNQKSDADERNEASVHDRTAIASNSIAMQIEEHLPRIR